MKMFLLVLVLLSGCVVPASSVVLTPEERAYEEAKQRRLEHRVLQPRRDWRHNNHHYDYNGYWR
jgi:hypothetical protein